MRKETELINPNYIRKRPFFSSPNKGPRSAFSSIQEESGMQKYPENAKVWSASYAKPLRLTL